MSLLASANLDALKSKEFLTVIHTAGRYWLYGCTVLSIGAMTSFCAIGGSESVGLIVAVFTAAGIDLKISRKSNLSGGQNGTDAPKG